MQEKSQNQENKEKNQCPVLKLLHGYIQPSNLSSALD